MHHHMPSRASPDQQLDGLISSGEVIADLGCGEGFYCQYLQKLASRLYCIDIDSESLEEAKKLASGSNVVFLNEDATSTSLQSESIDTVLLANSFHDMDYERAYEEIKRILKKGGKAIIIDWKKEPGLFGPPLSIRLSEDEYLAIFKDFKLETKKDLGHHYLLVLRKA